LQDRAGAGKNSVVPPRWTTKWFTIGVARQLRRFLRKPVLLPMQRLVFGVDGVLRPRFRLPAQPWSAAPAERGGEVVAAFPGAFEPARAMTVYGGTPADPVGRQVPRDPLLRLNRYDNVIILPHHVLLSAETGEVLPPTFGLRSTEGSFAVRRVADGKFTYPTHASLMPARAIKTPLFIADTMFRAYGHSLMEVLPKLAMLDAAPRDALVATSSLVLPELYAGLGATEERLLRFDRPLFCETVYVPDPPLDLTGNIHTLARATFARLQSLGEQSCIETPDFVYLSRVRPKERRLENEAEIEALFRARGFAIIEPESLSFADQIKLMTRAKGVAGPGGSAMHNLMFARSETRALFLLSPHWFVAIDQYVAQADGQFGAVFGTAGQPLQNERLRLRTWTVDPALVDAAISSHFGL
jgi:hypothetical protein